VNQPGKLTNLIAASEQDGPPIGYEANCFYTQQMKYNRLTGDHYPALNKPNSLVEYIACTNPVDEVLHILDPDMVYVQQLVGSVSLGQPIADIWSFMDPQKPVNRTVAERFCRKNRGQIQPIGIPLLIHREDLQLFVVRWRDLTIDMRADQATLKDIGWVCEMVACAIAAAEAGVQFSLTVNQRFLFEDFVDKPLIHYTHDMVSRTTDWSWGKRDYRPWDSIMPPPPDVPKAGKIFCKILQEAIEEFTWTMPDNTIGVPVSPR
jgi:hypothetical protein